ncbi:MAG: SMP-30/gluconolactonase/LRE family protein [Asticcacaulis sp.]
MWSAKDHAVWFVDIKKQHVHRYDVNIGSHQTFHAPSPCGFIAPKKRGGFIVGCKTGLYDFDPKTGHFELLTHVEPGLPSNRLNDGYIDHHGGCGSARWTITRNCRPASSIATMNVA